MSASPVILHVVDNFDPGGAQNILAGIVRHGSEGFRHEIAVLNGERSDYLKALPEGTPVHAFRFGPARLLRETLRLRALVKRLDPAVVSFNLEMSYLAFILLMPWLGGRRVNLAIHALPDQIPWFWYPLLAALHRRADAYTVEDGIARQGLLARGVPAAKVHLIPIGTEIFETTGETPESVRARRWGNRPEDGAGPRFLNIARMVEGKGQLHLLEAFKAYRDKGGRGRLTIIGYGPLEARLKSRAEELGIAQEVDFPGKIKELVPHYFAADVYVSSAVDEGMGVVIYDSMALGLPIAAFGAGSIAEIVEDGRNGRLVPNREAGSLASAMLELTDRGPAAEKISWTNSRKIFENYRNRRIVQRYADLYRTLMMK